MRCPQTGQPLEIIDPKVWENPAEPFPCAACGLYHRFDPLTGDVVNVE